MAHTPHELAEDFPDSVDDIRRLKAEDPHFARLVEAYHEINRAVHRAESQAVPVGEEFERDLRRQRMNLKDEIGRLLRAGA